jgi:hypothetical protein
VSEPHLFHTITDRIIYEIYRHNRKLATGRADFVVMPVILIESFHREIILMAGAPPSVADLSRTFRDRMASGDVRVMGVQVLTGSNWGAGMLDVRPDRA